MSDTIDLAQERQEMVNNAQINRIRSAGRQLHPNGLCRWCREPFGTQSKQLFCDTDCEQDYRKHQNIKGA